MLGKATSSHPFPASSSSFWQPRVTWLSVSALLLLGACTGQSRSDGDLGEAHNAIIADDFCAVSSSVVGTPRPEQPTVLFNTPSPTITELPELGGAPNAGSGFFAITEASCEPAGARLRGKAVVIENTHGGDA